MPCPCRTLRSCPLSVANVYFVTNRFEDSLVQIGKYKRQNERLIPPDSALFEYISLKRTGKDREARKMLEDYAGVYKGTGWESETLKYYLGRADEAEVLAMTRNRCDRAGAFYFIGYDFLLKGDRQRGVEYFQKALDTQAFGTAAYSGAGVMLQTMKTGETATQNNGRSAKGQHKGGDGDR